MNDTLQVMLECQLIDDEQADELVNEGLMCCGSYCSEAGCCPFKKEQE